MAKHHRFVEIVNMSPQVDVVDMGSLHPIYTGRVFCR